MKQIAFLILLAPLFVYSQNNDSSEFRFNEMIGTRVFVNKTVTSYNFTVSKYKNDVKISEKDYVNFDNPEPSRIIISSDENQASIRINSRYYKEDLFFEFKRIYKIVDAERSLFYYDFAGKSPCNVAYFVPNDGNQTLYIKCFDSNKNGTTLYFTMSKLEQL